MDNTTTISGIFQKNELQDDEIKQFPKEFNVEFFFKWDKIEGIESAEHPKFYKEKRIQEDIPVEEKEILEKTVRLDDGTLGDVVTCFLKEESWTYYCHPCMLECSTWDLFKNHIDSKEHTKILMRASHSRKRFLMKSPNNDLIMNKDTDTIPCNIQEKLDSYAKPLLGLEYLIESETGFIGIEGKPMYYCLLCDSLGKDDDIVIHSSSKEHYLKYFLMFFPTALEKLKQFAATNSIKTLVDGLIDHMAARIETEFGRLKPMQVEGECFDRLKFKILSEIDCHIHFRETKEKNFAECACLTHLHQIVCPVTTYQEKWLPLEEAKRQVNKMQKTDTEKIVPSDTNENPPSEQTQSLNNLDNYRKDKSVRSFIRRRGGRKVRKKGSSAPKLIRIVPSARDTNENPPNEQTQSFQNQNQSSEPQFNAIEDNYPNSKNIGPLIRRRGGRKVRKIGSSAPKLIRKLENTGDEPTKRFKPEQNVALLNPPYYLNNYQSQANVQESSANISSQRFNKVPGTQTPSSSQSMTSNTGHLVNKISFFSNTKPSLMKMFIQENAQPPPQTPMLNASVQNVMGGRFAQLPPMSNQTRKPLINQLPNMMAGQNSDTRTLNQNTASMQQQSTSNRNENIHNPKQFYQPPQTSNLIVVNQTLPVGKQSSSSAGRINSWLNQNQMLPVETIELIQNNVSNNPTYRPNSNQNFNKPMNSSFQSTGNPNNANNNNSTRPTNRFVNKPVNPYFQTSCNPNKNNANDFNSTLPNDRFVNKPMKASFQDYRSVQFEINLKLNNIRTNNPALNRSSQLFNRPMNFSNQPSNSQMNTINQPLNKPMNVPFQNLNKFDQNPFNRFERPPYNRFPSPSEQTAPPVFLPNQNSARPFMNRMPPPSLHNNNLQQLNSTMFGNQPVLNMQPSNVTIPQRGMLNQQQFFHK